MGAGGTIVLLALLLAPVLGLSTLRRLHDSERRHRFVGLTLFPFMLFSLSLAYSTSAMASLTCVVIASLLTFFLAIEQSTSSKEMYHQGYAGPVLSSTKVRCCSRIEPTFDGPAVTVVEEQLTDNKEHIPLRGQQVEFIQRQEEGGVTFDLWVIWAKQNQRLLFSVIGGILCLMVLSSIWSIFAPSVDNHDVEQPLTGSRPQGDYDRDEVKLAGGFKLLLEEEVLIMSWLGDSGEPGVIWSLATGKGDKGCAHLVFDNGSQYRPILVELMSDASIETRFTPLDTQEIITNIARRGSVNVCGYDFSLKGSQSVLAKSEAFTRYL